MRETTIDSFRGHNFFLSNFYEVEFEMPGLGRVATSEHAFNALKTTDPLERQYVLAAGSPAVAKRRGRSITLRADWDGGVRVRAMQAVLSYKFGSPEMRRRLAATGDAVLVEGNTHHDDFWGDCRCGGRRCARPGANMLGRLLMAQRVDAAAGVVEPPILGAAVPRPRETHFVPSCGLRSEDASHIVRTLLPAR